jgi:hypothetical protein
VADLEIALNQPEERSEAAEILRGLIDAIVLHPGSKRGEVRAAPFGEMVAVADLDPQRKTWREFLRPGWISEFGCGGSQPPLPNNHSVDPACMQPLASIDP